MGERPSRDFVFHLFPGTIADLDAVVGEVAFRKSSTSAWRRCLLGLGPRAARHPPADSPTSSAACARSSAACSKSFAEQGLVSSLASRSRSSTQRGCATRPPRGPGRGLSHPGSRSRADGRSIPDRVRAVPTSVTDRRPAVRANPVTPLIRSKGTHMKTNVGGADKIPSRIVPVSRFTRLGGVRRPGGPGSASSPLATGLLGWCPAYTMLGMNTCPLSK